MCGRYTLYNEKEDREIKRLVAEVNKKFQLEVKIDDIYPSDLAPIIRSNQNNQDGSSLDVMKWGYDNPIKKGLIINARSETVMEKPMFRDDFKARRCLIPATGFYEWDREKHQYLFQADQLLYLGGIYKTFNGTNKYVILTKEPNETVAEVHNRMPVIISSEMITIWLQDFKTAAELIKEDAVSLVKQFIKKTDSVSQLKFPLNY